MIDLSYHKGQKCVYGSTFCQEGFCPACNIHLSLSMESIFAPASRISKTHSSKRSSEFARVGSLQPI